MQRVMQGMLVAGVMLAWVGEASATLQFFQAFKKVHPEAKAACSVCHNGAVGKSTNLNTYGASIKALKGSPEGATLAAEALVKNLDTADADNDGASNADEIAKGTNAGDPVKTP